MGCTGAVGSTGGGAVGSGGDVGGGGAKVGGGGEVGVGGGGTAVGGSGIDVLLGWGTAVSGSDGTSLVGVAVVSGVIPIVADGVTIGGFVGVFVRFGGMLIISPACRLLPSRMQFAANKSTTLISKVRLN